MPAVFGEPGLRSGLQTHAPLLLRNQVVAAVVGDGDGGEFADGEVGVDEDAAVDVGGVPHGAGDAFFFDEDADGFAKLLRIHGVGGAFDGAGEFTVTFFDRHVVEVAVEFVGAGAVLP